MPRFSFDSTELPALAPHSHCVLIPRDPNYIYAYWDYAQQDIDSARNKLGDKNADSQLVLRVYDTTANHTWDLDVGFSTKNCYVHVLQDNADYCAELGVLSTENHFIPLMRSNMAHTPSQSTSKRNDLIWQEIKAHRESQPYIEEQTKPSKKKFHKGKRRQGRRIYHLTVQDIRDYYMRLFASVSKKGRRRMPSMEDILKGRWRGLSWAKVRPIITCPGLIRRIHGASMEFLESKGGASESLFSVQAGASEGRLNKRKFIFEIWSEVIVHGRTEPDAAVWLNSKNSTPNGAIGPFQKGIKLNPDGTFSLHYALPDGEIPFQFVAQSSDGVEQRHIYTLVERKRTVSFPKMLEKDGPRG